MKIFVLFFLFTLSPVVFLTFSGTGTTFPDPNNLKLSTLWFDVGVGGLAAVRVAADPRCIKGGRGCKCEGMWWFALASFAFAKFCCEGVCWSVPGLSICIGDAMDAICWWANSFAILSRSFFLCRQCFSYRIPNKTTKYSRRDKNTNNVQEMIQTSMHFNSKAFGELFLGGKNTRSLNNFGT